MATPRPQVSGNHDPSLATQCLAFIQALVNESKIGFNFHLTSGQFSCSFDSNGTVTAASARIPTEVKKKSSSPSTKRRNAKRRQLFLENKKLGSSFVGCEKPAEYETPQSACEKPPSSACNELPQTSAPKEPTQTFSERLSFPSSPESANLDTNDHGVGHITKKIRMDKVPPLKLLFDSQSTPRYRIQQLDGNSSLCENDQPSEHGDDSNKDQCPLCPNCDQTITSTFHQCQDSDHTSDQITQEPTTNLKTYTKMGRHTEKCEKNRKEWKERMRRISHQYNKGSEWLEEELKSLDNYCSILDNCLGKWKS